MKTRMCALLCIKLFPQQDDTKIINFDEGVLILRPVLLGKCKTTCRSRLY